MATPGSVTPSAAVSKPCCGSNWIARAEYRYADYGRFSDTDVRTAVLGVQTVNYDTTVRTHTATFGLAYKFGNTSAAGGEPRSLRRDAFGHVVDRCLCRCGPRHPRQPDHGYA